MSNTPFFDIYRRNKKLGLTDLEAYRGALQWLGEKCYHPLFDNNGKWIRARNTDKDGGMATPCQVCGGSSLQPTMIFPTIANIYEVTAALFRQEAAT